MNISEKKQYIINSGIGIAGGMAAYTWLPSTAVRACNGIYLNKAQTISKQDQDSYWRAAEIAMDTSGLKSKNVRLISINDSNAKTIADEIINKRKQKRKNNKDIFGRNKKQDQLLRDKIELMYARGRNACYMGLTSQILVNQEKMAFTAFHEMGHAYNAKFKGFSNHLNKIRGKSARYAPIVFATGLLIPKDREDKPTENFIYKGLLNLKKYAGLLVSLCLLPMVMEEGLASINGAKLAKKHLSPELYKKMNSFNAGAFSSYFIFMLMAGLGTTLAIYIKDKVTGGLPAAKN